MAITSGLYELRSMLLTSMAVDIAGGSAIRGANVQLYGSNDTNAQKFYVVEESADHWSIQNAQSLMYMDVARGTAANGTNIQQWSDNDSRAQRWNLIDTESTTTINGVACPIVYLGSYITDAGTEWVADVTHAMTTNKTNIQLHSANNTPAQRFALYPTTLQDASMPAPSGRGWATYLGAANSQTVQPSQAALYPCWYFTDAWNGLEQHGFEISYRSRLIVSGTATTGEWGEYTAWTAADVTLYGQTAWLTDGLPATFDSTEYKAIEYNLRVRSTSVVDNVRYHSKSVTMTLRAVFAPTVTCTGAVRINDFVSLTFSTDYEGGTTAVRITDMRVTNLRILLTKPMMGYGYGPTFDVDVPLSSMVGSTSGARKVYVSYEVGTDQYPATGITHQEQVDITDSPSKTLNITYSTLSYDTSLTLRVSLSGASTYTGYAYAEGERVPIAQSMPGVFIVPYSFASTGTSLVFIGQNTEGTAWGAAYFVHHDYVHQPCHVWNWGEIGYFKLDVSDGYLQTSRTIKGEYTDYQLNEREWHSLRFASTKSGEYTAEGTLKEGLTDSTKAQLLELMNAHNVLYRAPSGEMANVAITEIQYTTIRKRTNVTISMVQVSN